MGIKRGMQEGKVGKAYSLSNAVLRSAHVAGNSSRVCDSFSLAAV